MKRCYYAILPILSTTFIFVGCNDITLTGTPQTNNANDSISEPVRWSGADFKTHPKPISTLLPGDGIDDTRQVVKGESYRLTGTTRHQFFIDVPAQSDVRLYMTDFDDAVGDVKFSTRIFRDDWFAPMHQETVKPESVSGERIASRYLFDNQEIIRLEVDPFPRGEWEMVVMFSKKPQVDTDSFWHAEWAVEGGGGSVCNNGTSENYYNFNSFIYYAIEGMLFEPAYYNNYWVWNDLMYDDLAAFHKDRIYTGTVHRDDFSFSGVYEQEGCVKTITAEGKRIRDL